MGRFSVARCCCNPATLCYLGECGTEFEVPFQEAPFEYEISRGRRGGRFGAIVVETLFVEGDNPNFGQLQTRLADETEPFDREDVIRVLCSCEPIPESLRYDFGTNYRPVENLGLSLQPADSQNGPIFFNNASAEPWQVSSFSTTTNVTLAAIDRPIGRTFLTSPIDTTILRSGGALIRFSGVTRNRLAGTNEQVANVNACDVLVRGSIERIRIGGYNGSDNVLRNMSIAETTTVTATRIPGTEFYERIDETTTTAEAENGFGESVSITGSFSRRDIIRRCQRLNIAGSLFLNRDHDEIATGLNASIDIQPLDQGIDRPSPNCELNPDDPDRPAGEPNIPPTVPPVSNGPAEEAPANEVNFEYTPDNSVAVVESGTPVALTPTFPGGETGFANFVGVSGELPDGLTIDETTGVISGTTTELVSGVVHFQASNDAGEFAAGSFVFRVLADAGESAQFGYNDLTGEVDQILIGLPVVPPSLGSVDDYTDFMIFGLRQLPDGLEIDTTNGTISGVPTQDGTTAVTITARHVTTDEVITADALIEIVAVGDPPPNNTRDFWWLSPDNDTLQACSGFAQGRVFVIDSDLDLTQYTNFRITQGGGNGVSIDPADGRVTLNRTIEGEFLIRVELAADHVSNGTTIESFFFARFLFCGVDGGGGEVPNDGPGCCFESESTEAISFSQGNGSNTVDGSSNSINDVSGVSNASFTTTLPGRAISQGSDGTYTLTVDYSYQSADNPDRSYAQISATLLGQTFFLTEQPISGSVSFDFDFPSGTECNINVGVEFLDVFEFTPGEETPLANHAYNYERIATQEACDSSGAEGGL